MEGDSSTASTWFLPILELPVQFHSSRDPENCTLTPDQCALRDSYWVFVRRADLVYSLSVVYLFMSIIALFAIGRLAIDFAPDTIAKSRCWRRCVSALRFLAYKTLQVGGWSSQSIGFYLLAAIGITFFLAMTLGPRPYYWPTDAAYGDSPPIATRGGWMGLACLPFIFAFATKANVISALIGIPAERLIVWHNWASWAMLVLAFIHVFPFIIYHNSKGDLVQTFRTGGIWLTGVIALLSQAWLTIMSISWIRNKCYEFFKITHYFFATTFMVFFFIHCGFRLTSWDYFIATGAIYLASLLYALAKTYFKHGTKHSAYLRVETPQSLRLAIPTQVKWEPGQHVYLQFLTGDFHLLTSHPFTICSLPSKNNVDSEMVFHVQPRGGVTRRLASMASKQPDIGVRVLLEGPYGHLSARWYKGFDRTLLVAGGSGSAFTLSLLEDWLSRRHPGSTRKLNVLLATRDAGMPTLYKEELQRIAERQCSAETDQIPGLTIHFYETYDTTVVVSAAGPCTSGVDKEAGKKKPEVKFSIVSAESLFDITFESGRPDAKAAVRDIALQDSEGTVGVAVCGPAELVRDVSQAVAAQQQRILRGHAGAPEVWFHQESFSF